MINRHLYIQQKLYIIFIIHIIMNQKNIQQPTTTTTEDRLQNSSSASVLLDQFFNSEQTHETVPINNEKQVREQPSVALLRTSSSSNPTEDTTLLFVSKFARLAPIVPTHPTNGNTSHLSSDENNNSLNRSFHIDMNAHEQTFDTLHGLSGFHDENVTITDDLFPTGDMTHTSDAIDEGNESFSYVPLKEQRTRMDNVPLLELDELETNSDISESQLVPIIYAKELANEIELLQRAHSLKQQQRSMSTNHENDRINDNNSVPPPANMELLNFEALDEEFSVLHHHSEDSPLSSPRIPSTMMEVSSSPLVTETETPKTSILQHGILAHNRLSPWFKLPTELWFKILPYLTTNELHNFSYVCKRFYLLAQDQACQHKIIFTRRMQLDQLWFDVIARRKPISLTFIEGRQQNSENTLQSIESDANRIKWNEFFQTIGSNLFEFTMSGFYHEPFTPNTFLPLIVQTCSNLLSLNLRWNHITESTLNHLINYPQFIHLQTLDLTGCQTLDDTLLINIFIRTETEFHLKKLILHACTNITWISLDTIAICIPTLVHLNISRCIGFKNLSTNSNSTCFHYWSKLEYINFDHLLTITDNDLTIVFDHCKYLHTLIFDDCMNITDQTLHHLTTNFRMISLNNCTNLSTDVLANLNEQCPQLEIVNFNSINNFNDNCLLKWSEKPLMKLQRLSLDNCKQCSLNSIDKFLTKHVNLRELSITGDIVSNLIERKILQEKFPYIKFVFQ
ncbi:hypothetical protein I4U23_024071 [Adineta vaga]|nr:hypothetical protein I4U23_024071 [Adineta vaga]